ncbi:MAG: penicillin-binding transpeptidase domain-containing protein [Terriglobales bacterium]
MANKAKWYDNPKARLYLLGGLLMLWVFAIGCRLASLQVIHYRDWLQRAQKQQQRTIEITPARGVIYDRNGQELAMSVQVDSIFAVPADVPDHAMAAELLGRVLGMNAAEIQQKLDSGKTFVWIARKVDNPISSRVRDLRLKGIYFQKEPKRFYPKRELAAQVLGYVGLDDEGLGGIELSFDETLRGIPGRMHVSLDARRKRLGRVERQPEPGQNIVLTIDQNIQYIAEREIERAMQETKAEAATIVVQNPRTGEILALANRPTFNPNRFSRVPAEQLKNRAISDVYEPGSMFKTVTVSAALEEKVTKPDDLYDASQGFIVVGGRRMRDAHRMGVLTTAEVVAQSSNVGAIKIGMRLGEERLHSYIRAYGFGQATGIELPGETRGLVKPVKNWSKTSIGAMSMGQEVGVTAIQATSAISTIANDGVWNAPRIVAGVTPPNAGPQTITFRPAEQRRVVSTLTAVQMKQMLERVVLFGTGRRALLDGYTSAGKTGTAQKVDPKTRRYGNKYVASFIGFAPVNRPAVTVAVIIDSAMGLHQGGQISAPVFQRVAQQVLEYLQVPHDTELKPETRRQLLASIRDRDLDEDAPDHVGEPLELAETTAPATDTRPVLASRTTKPALMPAASTQAIFVPAAQAATPTPEPLMPPAQPGPQPATGVVVNVDGVMVPSFLGKSLRAAIEAAQAAGVVLDVHGSGIAREQAPLPGTRVPPGGRVAVRFAR